MVRYVMGGMLLIGACGSEETDTTPPPTTSVVSSSSSGVGGAAGEGGTPGEGGSGATGGAPPVVDCFATTATFTAGLPSEPVCPEPTCTSGAPCISLITAPAGSDLQVLAGMAAEGDCLALEPGIFGDVDLPPGVSLLGRSAAEVNVGAITASGVVMLRGIAVSGGVEVSGPGALTLDRVAVQQAPEAGVIVVDADLVVLDSCVAENGNAGIYVACDGDCGCPPPRTADLQRTVVRANPNVGVWFDGAQATMTDVLVADSAPLNFTAGHGVFADDCAKLTASTTILRDNAAIGLLLWGAGAQLGPDLSIERNQHGGLSACNVPAAHGLDVSGFSFVDNDGYGLVVGGATTVAQLTSGTISGTKPQTVPVLGGGSETIGDGIQWVQDAQLTVAATVQISQSGRTPAVIDASSNGSFDAVLSGGDETIGIFLQNGAAPQVGSGIMQTQPATPLHVLSCP